MTNFLGRENVAVRAMLTGLHKTTKRLASGKVAIYAYAFRGGPMIARAEARDLASANRAMEKELGTRGALDRLEEARRPIRATVSKAYIRGMIAAFKASPEWDKLGKSSQDSYAYYLNDFDAEFGDWRVSLFDRLETRTDLLDWRDEWADTPRAADYAMQSVGRLFSWARGRGLTLARPTDDIPRLHKADRSDIIWSQEDINAFCAQASAEVGWVVRLAAETGLRLGDLARLTWGAVGSAGIVWRTRKRSKQALIPITPKLRQLLDSIPKRSTVVLTNTRKLPWTVDGLKTMIGEAKRDAGLEGLHFHDLRGTAVTRIYLVLPDSAELARIFGWTKDRVEDLLIRYVSGDAVALDLLKRMNQKPAAQTDDKPVSSGSS